ncbi:aminotransferase class I/II-fold pyridoxal phosphate-dependent enzyme [Methanocaldococcus indicus]|uniref:aminotransferase class I/II-fold pyridoxal phosphate-dependent enzyme n=1 Tax=Methanocaldococcus indicus TaxID=213231 RepID=UPI003C6CFDD5
MIERIKKELEEIKKLGLYRKLLKKKGLDFSSNDYLCLSKHPEIIQAVKEGLKYGFGASGSRLTSGNINHEILEERLAEFKETERALTFPTGYQTNVGVISTLCKKGDLILSDELNHASIIDGCRLSKADRIIYKHLNYEEVENILEREYKNYEDIFIITDTVFSMDGDLADLKRLKKIADEYSAILIVDDAHGTGTVHKKGALKYFNVKGDNIIQIGTLSKAFGGLGGFVCSTDEVIEYLINRCRSFIYTTALPPCIVEGCLKALEIIDKGKLTKKLQKNINLANKIFKDFILEEKVTPIYPFIFKDKTMEIANYLQKNNIFCVAIRYPTVPKGLERIRVSINVNHKKDDLKLLCEKIKEKLYIEHEKIS